MSPATETFGHSLTVEEGDLVLQDGVLQAVRGKRNLLQALELRVLTPFGSDPFNTTYGLDIREAFTQPGGIRTVKELIKLNLVRTLATDPRVSDIREVIFDDELRYLERHPESDPATLRARRQRRTWRVEVIIDTVNDETEVVPVRIGV